MASRCAPNTNGHLYNNLVSKLWLFHVTLAVYAIDCGVDPILQMKIDIVVNPWSDWIGLVLIIIQLPANLLCHKILCYSRVNTCLLDCPLNFFNKLDPFLKRLMFTISSRELSCHFIQAFRFLRQVSGRRIGDAYQGKDSWPSLMRTLYCCQNVQLNLGWLRCCHQWFDMMGLSIRSYTQ